MSAVVVSAEPADADAGVMEPADAGVVAPADAGVAEPVDAGAPSGPDAGAAAPQGSGAVTATLTPPPRVETPSPAPEKSDYVTRSLQGGDVVATVTGGWPVGTLATVLRHAELGVLFGSERLPNATSDTAMRGFRYAERGGFLTNALGTALATASAQSVANSTGKSAVIHDEGADSAALGAAIEYRTTDGGRFIVDLDLTGPVGELFGCPFLVGFALTGGFVGGMPTGGVLLKAAAPLTRWAQADVEWHLLAVGSEFQAALSLFPGNRFFARAALLYTPGGGPGNQVLVGVRL